MKYSSSYESTQYRSISSNNEQYSIYLSFVFQQQHAIVFMKYYSSSSNKCTQYRSISLNNEQ